MSEKQSNPVVYNFILADKNSHKEIGSISEDSILNEEEKLKISQKITEIINDSLIEKNKRIRIDFDTTILFYTLSQNVIYIAVVDKLSKFSQEENLVYELIEDIDNKGVKKLLNEQGLLTKVAKQNLKCTIDNYISSSETSIEVSHKEEVEEKKEKNEKPNEEEKQSKNVEISNEFEIVDQTNEIPTQKSSLEIDIDKDKQKEIDKQKLKNKMRKYKICIAILILLIIGCSILMFYLKKKGITI